MQSGDFMIYGYARSATNNPMSLQIQRELLQKSNAVEIVEEVVSGAATERPKLSELIDKLQEGDQIIVTSIDRLGRDAITIKKIVDKLNRKKIVLLTVEMYEEIYPLV